MRLHASRLNLMIAKIPCMAHLYKTAVGKEGNCVRVLIV